MGIAGLLATYIPVAVSAGSRAQSWVITQLGDSGRVGLGPKCGFRSRMSKVMGMPGKGRVGVVFRFSDSRP